MFDLVMTPELEEILARISVVSGDRSGTPYEQRDWYRRVESLRAVVRAGFLEGYPPGLIDRLGEVYDAVCKGHDLHEAFRLVERCARVGLSPEAVASLTAHRGVMTYDEGPAWREYRPSTALYSELDDQVATGRVRLNSTGLMTLPAGLPFVDDRTEISVGYASSGPVADIPGASGLCGTVILRHDPCGQFFPLTVRALLAEMGETGPPRYRTVRRPSSWDSMTADEIHSEIRAAVRGLTESK